MHSLHTGKHFTNFIHKEIHCVQNAETIENIVSWLSEQHYLNETWPWLKARCGGDILIFVPLKQCKNQGWFVFLSLGSVTLSKAQSHCLGLLICGTDPGIPFTPTSQPCDVKSSLRVQHYIGINYKVLKHVTKFLLNSIVYCKNIFSSRNSCESGIPA